MASDVPKLGWTCGVAAAQAWEDRTIPEISRFFGIIIRMFAEAGGPHHRAHFHVYYQGHDAVFGIGPVELLAGSMPRPQQRLVEAWAMVHEVELGLDWDRLQGGLPPMPIDPLR